MSDIIKTILAGIIIVLLCALAIVVSMGFELELLQFWTDGKREVFKESITYNEEAAEFIAESLREYNTAITDTERSAIAQYLVQRYPNLDSSTIENADLREFYEDCILGLK